MIEVAVELACWAIVAYVGWWVVSSVFHLINMAFEHIPGVNEPPEGGRHRDL